MTETTTDDGDQTIEAAFARAEAEADAAIKAATAVLSTLKRYRSAARQGKIRDIRVAGEAARQGIDSLDAQVADLAESWSFDDEGYLQNGGYVAELIGRAEREGLRIAELDGRLYCYPSLIRVLPGERALSIDKAKERRLRPSVLVEHLKEIQKRPPRFRPGEFLESLYSAYKVAIKQQNRSDNAVVPLGELYDLLTMLPGQSREYAKAEFARDIYLLDQSRQTAAKDGAHIEFHTGAGARVPRGALSVVTQHGEEKKYHGISFVATAGA
jgi:hypothetical protein